MHRITALTIKERAVSLNPAQVFQDRPGLVMHETFRQRIMPALEPVDLVTRGRYQALPLGHQIGPVVSYPRFPRNTCPRWEPSSDEVFEHLKVRTQGVLIPWEHVAFLLALQPVGQDGILVTSGTVATLCFMRGKNGESFLVRIFWNSGPKLWFLRAWSFKERQDRGWSRLNWLLLPIETQEP